MGSRRALCRAMRDSRREQVGWVGDNWSQVQFEEGEENRRRCRAEARDPFAMSARNSRWDGQDVETGQTEGNSLLGFRKVS